MWSGAAPTSVCHTEVLASRVLLQRADTTVKRKLSVLERRRRRRVNISTPAAAAGGLKPPLLCVASAHAGFLIGGRSVWVDPPLSVR